MPEPVLVAVAHGSADPRASATITELAAVARARSPWSKGLDLRTAFLGHAPPSLPQVLSTIEAGREVTVLPLLLTEAYHSKADIPRLLARFPRLRIGYGATLGPHPLLLRALERRLAEADPLGVDADPSRTAVVLAAAARATTRRTPPSRDWPPSGRPGPGGSRSGRPTLRPPSPPPPRRWPACCGTERPGWWSPPTCSPLACSPTGSVSPRWPPAPRPSRRRWAPAPR